MEDHAGFEGQFTSLMQNVLKTAVCETTKLFEHTLHQLKAELVQLRQENVDLKTGVFITPHKTGNGYQRQDHGKRDIGVQCDKPIMVERCCSPALFGDSNLLRRISSDRLTDLCSSSEEGNRQLALLLIKKEPQESDCDEYSPGYFLLKQEGAEPILVRKEPFKNTMERVSIPPTLQTVSRCNRTSKEIATRNMSSETSAFCGQRTATSSSTQTTSTSGIKRGDTEGDKHFASANTKPAKSAQPLSTITLSSPAVLPSRLGQIPLPKAQQIVAPVQAVEPIESNVQLRISQPQQIVQQKVQHSTAVTHFAHKQIQSSFHQQKNQGKEPCTPVQPFHNPAATRDRVPPVFACKSIPPLSEASIQPLKTSVSSHQAGTAPVQNMTVLAPFPGPRGQVSLPPGQYTVTSGQVHISLSQIPPPSNQGSLPPPQVMVPPMHYPVPSTHALVPPNQAFDQPNQLYPHNSQSSNLQNHMLSLPHTNLAMSSQPHYTLTQVPFAAPFNSIQSVKASVTQTSISQTNASPPLEHTASHYEMLPDPLCASSDQFFPVPDNASDLLQTLAPMPFHSPIVLTPQESTAMVHTQSSGQNLQLAPLLTLKEQQGVVSNQGNVSKRIQNMPVDITVSTVNHFEEQMQRFPPLAGLHMNSHGAESITVEIHDEDPFENNEDSSPVLMSCPREHQFTVLSKPEPNFIVPDSTKDQHIFRINMVKDSQLDDISKLHQGCDTTCQAWEASDLASVIPQIDFNIPAQNLLQKPARKFMEKKTECSECGRILSNASSLENHMRLHRGERPYTCSQCGKAFPSVRGLNRHIKVHAEEKKYKCEECGRSFVYQFTLTKHKLIHSGDRPFPCKVCGKKFLAKADRATHMRMHTGEKPFFCSQCGKTFKHRVALNMHMQGHRGEKRYVCPHCEKGFVDLGNFKRHKRIHTGEKPFECKECGKRFTQSAHLKKHVNTQHLVHKPKLISLPNN